jgi:hypothetical protein
MGICGIMINTILGSVGNEITIGMTEMLADWDLLFNALDFVVKVVLQCPWRSCLSYCVCLA